METYFENTNNEDIQSLNSIYQQLSINENDLFDEIDENKLLYNYIDNCFTIEFKRIDNKKIIDDINLFNTKLVQFIKYCKENKFNRIDIIFLIFCDYFDLPYNLMYTKLHPKIKENILNRYIEFVGIDEYNEQKNKFEGVKDYTQPTLFEILKSYEK